MAERLDWPGVFGLGLLAFCAAFYLSTALAGDLEVHRITSYNVCYTKLLR